MPYRLLYFNAGKALTVGVTSLFSIFAPVKTLVFVALLFMMTDFVLGLIVSIRVRKQGLMSSKIYNSFLFFKACKTFCFAQFGNDFR